MIDRAVIDRILPRLQSVFQAPPAEARLLPEGRMAGPMPWVIAIIMFLTVLAAATGISLARSAKGLDADLAGRLTIQIVEANAARRDAQADAVARELGRLAAVKSFRRVPDREVAALLEPWFGAEGMDADLPVPTLIDATLDPAAPGGIETLTSSIARIAPSARVEQHAQWLGPLARLLGSLTWLAWTLVVMMAGATTAIVVLAARSALNTHRATIEVMHLLGATDVQIARLFQKRIALDALFGGGLGLGLALLTMLLLNGRLAAVGSELLGSVGIGWAGWLFLLATPLLGAGLATVAARMTVMAALRRML
jgi:cell division transport system permease protein